MLTQNVSQAVNVERCLHAVTHAPTAQPPRRPIDRSHQVGTASRQPQVGDLHGEDLISPNHGHAFNTSANNSAYGKYQ